MSILIVLFTSVLEGLLSGEHDSSYYMYSIDIFPMLFVQEIQSPIGPLPPEPSTFSQRS